MASIHFPVFIRNSTRKNWMKSPQPSPKRPSHPRRRQQLNQRQRKHQKRSKLPTGVARAKAVFGLQKPFSGLPNFFKKNLDCYCINSQIKFNSMNMYQVFIQFFLVEFRRGALKTGKRILDISTPLFVTKMFEPR
jgi:hypothetical protein